MDLSEARNRGCVRLRRGELTAEYLPDGHFARRVRVFRTDIGDHAGCFERDGYLTRIAEKLTREHHAHSRRRRQSRS